MWKTFPEYLEEAGISWQVWQDMDNFEDNMLAYFEQYQTAKNGSALRTRGNSYPGLDAFYDAAAKGTLPQVSWIVGPQEQSEHAPNLVKDGAWLQKKVVDAITQSPAYNETVLVISYDGMFRPVSLSLFFFFPLANQVQIQLQSRAAGPTMSFRLLRPRARPASGSRIRTTSSGTSLWDQVRRVATLCQ